MDINTYTVVAGEYTQWVKDPDHSLEKISGMLVDCARIAYPQLPEDINQWKELDTQKVFDSILYNRESADKCDGRNREYKTYFDFLYQKLKVFEPPKRGTNVLGERRSVAVDERGDLHFGMSYNLDGKKGCYAEQTAVISALSHGAKDVQFVMTIDGAGKITRMHETCWVFMWRIGLGETWVAVGENLWLPIRDYTY